MGHAPWCRKLFRAWERSLLLTARNGGISVKANFEVGRLPQVDWLRALAAFGVFVFHVSGLAGFPKFVLPAFNLGTRHFSHVPSFFTLGATGVNLFFVLSGFCLALQQWRKGNTTIEGRALRNYARNRVARIVPAYWAAVLFSAVIAICLGSVVRKLLLTTSLHLLFLHGFDPYSFLSLNGALWSMAIEVQFYFCFPVLLRVYHKLGAGRFLLLLGSASVSYRLLVGVLPLPTQPISGIELSSLLSYQLPGRILEFALGMWLADAYLHRRDEWRAWFRWGWIPILPLALWTRAAGPRPLADPMMGLLYCAITGSTVFVMGVRTGGFTSWVEKQAATLGRASYSFFLIHVPVIDVVARFSPADPAHPYTSFVRLALIGGSISAAVAAALYQAIELPLWNRFRSSPEREVSAAPVARPDLEVVRFTPTEEPASFSS